ncbi:ABC transporter substrate-binding protein [Comamonas serinivorans]|uniref:ABC transporter substrate-binding protein n=1 Tax=Comamonas serinivorans TaxID=1082851 RepID=A0A1Y0ER31_9BURK|nr:tripartite tricarboxylate transporter substrate binding protein [Comamonas serinivorans]ARU06036.1 ABC transporter substrate-binding protein [Comamonas serinivorans]
MVHATQAVQRLAARWVGWRPGVGASLLTGLLATAVHAASPVGPGVAASGASSPAAARVASTTVPGAVPGVPSVRGAATATATATAGTSSAASATLRPTGKPLTIVVTFPPGGGTDLLARRLGAELQTRLGQTVLVENRPGASGNIGAQHVAQAAPDGQTLLMVNSSFAINPGVYQKLDFDPQRDFTAVVNAGFIASVLVVPADSALHSLEDALAAARSADRPLAFASCGNGTPQHLAGEMLAQATRSHWQHVPYKGCGPAITAVAAGQVPAGLVTASSASAMMAGGRVRALAITSPKRLPQLAQVPTVAEQGVPGFDVEQWHGLLAPAGTPAAVVARLHQAAQLALQGQAMRQLLDEQGYSAATGSPAAFQALILADMDRYAAVTRKLGLRVD